MPETLCDGVKPACRLKGEREKRCAIIGAVLMARKRSETGEITAAKLRRKPADIAAAGCSEVSRPARRAL
jgi:DeoR/GlpR family transcriptional regulator of sugar metabolism